MPPWSSAQQSSSECRTASTEVNNSSATATDLALLVLGVGVAVSIVVWLLIWWG